MAVLASAPLHQGVVHDASRCAPESGCARSAGRGRGCRNQGSPAEEGRADRLPRRLDHPGRASAPRATSRSSRTRWPRSTRTSASRSSAPASAATRCPTCKAGSTRTCSRRSRRSSSSTSASTTSGTARTTRPAARAKDKFEAGLKDVDRQDQGRPARAWSSARRASSARRPTAATSSTRSSTSTPTSAARWPRTLKLPLCDLRKAFVDHLKKNNPENKDERHPDQRPRPPQRRRQPVRRRADAGGDGGSNAGSVPVCWSPRKQTGTDPFSCLPRRRIYGGRKGQSPSTGTDPFTSPAASVRPARR